MWRKSVILLMIATTAAIFPAFVAKQLNSRLVVDKSLISINRETGERVYLGAAFTGDALTYYPSGEVASLEQYEDGRWHGKRLRWFRDGSLAQESFYDREKPIGVSRSWWSNGNLQKSQEYKNGKLHGEVYRWYESGQVFKMITYNEGQVSGLQQAWRENGALFANYEYKNGRVFGLNKSNLCFGLEDEKIALNY